MKMRFDQAAREVDQHRRASQQRPGDQQRPAATRMQMSSGEPEHQHDRDFLHRMRGRVIESERHRQQRRDVQIQDPQQER